MDPNAAPLDPSKTRQLGLVLSRFEFNGLANPNYKAGRFSLKVYKSLPSACTLICSARDGKVLIYICDVIHVSINIFVVLVVSLV